MKNTALLLACALVAAGCAKRHATPAPLAATPPATTPADAPFAEEIAAFEAIDRSEQHPAPGGVVFYGSSSIRIWATLSTDFPGLPVVNRGFGGSTTDQCVMYLDRAVGGLKPRMLVVYAGDNDLAAGRSVDRVVADTKELIFDIRSKLPGTKIVYLSIKPSPARSALLDKVKDANARIKSLADREHFDFVDLATPMLGVDGQPRPELFGPDRLHMNAAGYALWTPIVKPFLR